MAAQRILVCLQP